ncbi:MAG: thioredoxin family protein [Oligoflexia bacterium]|nr:thioredoxin family protein [Oligoflexia bacterium]MBF0365282.1 thioredoxin family protein [Oligoflexia bacterium]
MKSFYMLTIFLLLSFTNKLHANQPLVELLVKTASFDSSLLALYFKNQEGWHTYWKNPGSAGLSFDPSFTLNNQAVTLPALEWPLPKRYLKNQYEWSYGYEGVYGIYFKLPSLSATQTPLMIKVRWLACKETCVPGESLVQGSIQEGKFTYHDPTTPAFSITSKQEESNLQNIPDESILPDNLNVQIIIDEQERLYLYSQVELKSRQHLLSQEHDLLLPFPHPLFTFGLEEVTYDQDKNILLSKRALMWEGDFQTPPLKLPLNGIFSPALQLKFLYANPFTAETRVITSSIPQISSSSSSSSNSMITTAPEAATTAKKSTSLWVALLFAFLGGFILNFMPCVLPVISLKFFALMQQRSQLTQGQATHLGIQSTIIKSNLAYIAGVLATMLLLALAVIILKQGGEAIGWGFHLQSPLFVFALTLLLFLFALSLLGLYEFSTPGGKLLSVAEGHGNSHTLQEFFNGILATVLATPCSAPFLGTALTYAFTAPFSHTILLFLTIGVGLALPFIIIIPFPGALSLLPKPGAWMNSLKKFFGVLLLLTTLWPLSILFALTNSKTLLLLVATLMLATTLFFYFKNALYLRRPLYWSFTLLLLLSSISLGTAIAKHVNTSDQVVNRVDSELAWSEALMAKLQQEKRLSFIYFTAKWCLTCKTNERLVLMSKEFHDLIKEQQLLMVKADWTRKDPEISKWLAKAGYAGVPAYFVINKKGQLVNLGEMITVKRVANAIKGQDQP